MLTRWRLQIHLPMSAPSQVEWHLSTNTFGKTVWYMYIYIYTYTYICMYMYVYIYKIHVCGHAASCLALSFLEVPEAAEAASPQCSCRIMAREVLGRWSESPCQEALHLHWEEVISAKFSAMAPQKLWKDGKSLRILDWHCFYLFLIHCF